MRIVASSTLFIILLGVLGYVSIEALQCYDCVNCLEDEELSELHICGELPPARPTTKRPGVPVTTTITTTTAAASAVTGNGNTTSTTIITTTVTTRRPITTKKPSDSDDSDELNSSDFDEISDENSFETVKRTTLRPGNIRTTTKSTTTTRKTTPNKPVKDDDSGEDSDSDWDDDDDDRRRAAVKPKMPKLDEAVCYMVRVSVNGSLITRRGCTAMVKGNNMLTCESLNKEQQSMIDCQLCDTNGCNKFRTDDLSAEALWNGAKRHAVAKSWWMVLLMLMGVCTIFV